MRLSEPEQIQIIICLFLKLSNLQSPSECDNVRGSIEGLVVSRAVAEAVEIEYKDSEAYMAVVVVLHSSNTRSCAAQ